MNEATVLVGDALRVLKECLNDGWLLIYALESGQSPGTIISVSDLDGKRAASINAKGDCTPTLSQGMPHFDAPEIKPASKRRGFLQKLSRR